MLHNSVILEICTGDPEGVLAAVRGGANRVELCSGLSEGGLTPSVGMIRFSVPRITTNVLIRPRAGDFIYTSEELQVMERDIEEAVACGVAGIVTGALTPDGRVDMEGCSRLIGKAAGLDNTFHRAFDLVADPFQALEDIISLGFKRLLTSGQSATALEGSYLIRQLRRRAAGRINIIAGSGVTPVNAPEIIRISGAEEIHASARSLKSSPMESSCNVSMGSGDFADGSRMATDRDVVAAIRQSLDSPSPED